MPPDFVCLASHYTGKKNGVSKHCDAPTLRDFEPNLRQRRKEGRNTTRLAPHTSVCFIKFRDKGFLGMKHSSQHTKFPKVSIFFLFVKITRKETKYLSTVVAASGKHRSLCSSEGVSPFWSPVSLSLGVFDFCTKRRRVRIRAG